jgi:hypothetical protein
MSQEPDQFAVMYHDGAEWKAGLRTRNKEEAVDAARRLKVTDGIKLVSLQAAYRKADGSGLEWQKVPFEIRQAAETPPYPFVVQGLKPQWVELGRAATREQAQRIADGCQGLGLDGIRVWDEQTNSASGVRQEEPPKTSPAPQRHTPRTSSSSGGGNMLVKLQNDQTRDIKIVRIGFDWPAFFSPIIFGIPHFVRGMHVIGGVLLAISLVQLLPLVMEMGEGAANWLVFTPALVKLGLAIFFGVKGREQFAKHLLENGYDFSDPDSESVSMAKASWGIV